MSDDNKSNKSASETTEHTDGLINAEEVASLMANFTERSTKIAEAFYERQGSEGKSVV